MPEAVIVATGRTPIGRAKKGSLKDERPDDLTAYIVGKVLEKIPQLLTEEVDDLILGCCLPYGEQGYNLSRCVALLAGLAAVPGVTVSRGCASSIQAIRMAYHAIKAGEGEVFLVAGVESITRIPPLPSVPHSDLNPRLYDGNAAFRGYISMGETAEIVAEKFNVSREEMDRFAQRSQEKAVAGQDSGFFSREIIPYPLSNGVFVERDDGPRRGSSLEKLGSLEAAFKIGGRVTAGNSCSFSDGAAALVVMSDCRAKKLGIQPLARIVGSSVSGIEPEIMGMGPVEAVRKVCSQTGMSLHDIAVVELNEAFAAQVLPVCRELGLDPFSDQVNPHGGAIALGHPYGMTGVRIVTTLINDLKTLNESAGLATLCVGGGQGMAMVIERLA